MVFRNYRFQVTNPEDKPMKHFMAMAKIARNEKTGFFLDYKTQFPSLFNASITRNKEDYIINFKSNCIIDEDFLSQLGTFLKASKTMQIKSKN